MPRLLKHLVAILFVLIVAGCGGGGCSGCSGCGMTPLPGGFPADNRIENAGSVRLTDSGIKFLQDNVGTLAKTLLASGNGGVLTFNVPETSGSQKILGFINFKYTVCPGGADPNANPPKCVAEIDVGNAPLTVKTQGPHDIVISGKLPIRLRDLPISTSLSDIDVTLTGNQACPGDNADYVQMPVNVDISIEIDTDPSHSRYGYSKVKVVKLDIDQDTLNGSIKICGGILADVIDFLKGLVIGQVTGPLISTLQSQIDSQLCMKANANVDPPCPTGTSDVNGVCRYGNDDKAECASIMLGTDGHIDLGKLLAKISPGTTGGLDILFAAGGQTPSTNNPGITWGDLDPANGGATLGMYGGAQPMPISGCVRLSDVKLPAGIPIPAELYGNTVTDWPANIDGPHVGIAVSERFADYALNGLYNSGLLCIGVTSEVSSFLNSGTFGLLASSLKDLGIQREAQQVAIVIRPGQPPHVKFGNGTDPDKDPLIRVTLKQASLDFYMFSLDRFIRFMTATFDLDVPVNLDVTPSGLAPVIGKLGVDNGKVTNSELLKEDPALIAGALGSIIKGQVGQAIGGGIKPIDLSASLKSLGLTLTIPPSVKGKGSPGLRKLSQDSDNFLGIFATLGLAQAPYVHPPTKTFVEVRSKEIDPKGLRLVTMTPENVPAVRLHLGSTLDDGSREVEWQWKLDEGLYGPWTSDRDVVLRDDWLRVQGRHKLSVRSRAVGDTMSMDEAGTAVELTIDAEPPKVEIGDVADGKVAVRAHDHVAGDKTELRWRLDGGRWSAWQAASATIEVGNAARLSVEARDEDGNVGSTEQALIRGRAPLDAASSSGCGCTVVGQDETPPSRLALVALAVLGAALRVAKRRRAKTIAERALTGAAVAAIAGSFAGCNCGNTVETTPDDTGAGGQAPDAGKLCTTDNSCEQLNPGLVGSYSSVATAPDGSVWVAGYMEADWSDGNTYQWGDLVVGKYANGKVEWVPVDGVPNDDVDTSQYDPKGFRGGQTSPGDDVGLWTSIAIGSGGNPLVAYYDRTNKQLKLAVFDGAKWSVQKVEGQQGSDIGRYAKLVIAGGTPTIAYLVMEPGEKGAVTTKVRVATAGAAVPTEGGWSFEDAVVDKASPCRAQFCSSGTACVVDTRVCTKQLDDKACGAACGTGEACVDQGGGKGACSKVYDKSRIDSYPDAVGDYIAAAAMPSGGIGIAYYDRVHGNLGIARKASGKWTSIIVDGQKADGTDTGDVGVGASLFIDDKGDWHLSYVDGYSEALKYLKVKQGTQVGTPEVADDGLNLGGQKFPDGQHLVGDDSHVFVTPSGEVHISYQDATAGTLHHAVGSAAGDKHNWTVKAVAQEGKFAGAFSSVVQVNGQLQLMNWWRTGGSSVKGDVAFVAP
jgi:MYXO-CTERM domain-containing protein